MAFFTLYASFTTDMSRIFSPDTLVPLSPNRTVAVTLAPARTRGDPRQTHASGRAAPAVQIPLACTATAWTGHHDCLRTCGLAIRPQQQGAGEARNLVVGEVSDVPVAHLHTTAPPPATTAACKQRGGEPISLTRTRKAGLIVCSDAPQTSPAAPLGTTLGQWWR